MGGISAVSGQYGFTNPVLARDDTLIAVPTPPAAVSAAAPTPATVLASASPAQKLALGNLTLEGQMASALFASAPAAVDLSSLFFGGPTTSAPAVDPSSVFFGGTTASAPAADASSVFFGGGATAGLLNNTLSAAATSYLLQQPAPATGSTINATA